MKPTVLSLLVCKGVRPNALGDFDALGVFTKLTFGSFPAKAPGINVVFETTGYHKKSSVTIRLVDSDGTSEVAAPFEKPIGSDDPLEIQQHVAVFPHVNFREPCECFAQLTFSDGETYERRFVVQLA